MRFRLRSPNKIQLSESDVAKACIDLLRLRGYWVVRQHVGKFQTKDGRWITIGERGLPDYVALAPPGFLFETKRPGEKLSLEQQKKINELELGYGLTVAVIDSVEALKVWLDEHERRMEIS